MKYMSKALTYEMRDAVKISNENFRIASNITAEENTIKAREAYLSEIESSKDTSYQMQLRRKLAGALSPSVAYSLLMSTLLTEIGVERAGTNSARFKINLDKNLVLSESEHQIILKQVQSVYGKDIEHLDIVVSKSVLAKESISTQTQVQLETRSQEHIQKPPQPLEGIWGKIRQELVEHYGSNGVAMDNAWFSKLTADIDATDKKLTLKAPTKFIKDWIHNHYLWLIDQICSNQNYNLIEISM